MITRDLALAGRPDSDAALILAGTLANDEQAPTLLLSEEERRYVTESPAGLSFRDDTPLAVWGLLTARLVRAHKRLEFALADAINFGEGHMKARHGERYAQWIADTGRSYQGLRDIAWVGRSVPPAIRHPELSFAAHKAVAPLPPALQESVLKLAHEHDWSREQVRAAASVAQNELAKAERALLAPATAITPDCEVRVGDARALALPDGVVDLIVTSPPYALDKAYGAGGDERAASWFDFIRDVSREALRVSSVGARFALNVALDTSARTDPASGLVIPSRPTYAQAVSAGLAAGWSYRTTIIWHDDHLGKSTARGSYDADRRTGTANAPSIITPVETIILFFKGDAWRRPDPEHPSDLDHPDWLAWTNGFWELSGEQHAWEGHPAPFPLELPRRLIHLLSFPGDLVLDPFVGSGTTALAALRAGRRFYGVDSEAEYVEAARRRVAREGRF